MVDRPWVLVCIAQFSNFNLKVVQISGAAPNNNVPLPRIVSFGIKPITANAGQMISIYWQVEDANKESIGKTTTHVSKVFR